MNNVFSADYYEFIKNPSNENLEKYFKKIKFSTLITDMFNVLTYFYYEKDISINLIKFFDYYEAIRGICKPPICAYDIILFINFMKNVNKSKNEIHVIYNGLRHKVLFNYFYSYMYEPQY